jgi:ribosomal protein S18 acetylase RimI-like enzyme
VSSASIVRAGIDRIGELEPVWRSLYEHHAEVGEEVAPVRPLHETWRRRRREYQRWLTTDEASLLLADRGGRAIGYAMLRLNPGPVTWDIGEQLVEVETLAVIPEERGSGIGRALLEEAARVARELGAEALDVGLVHTNEGAQRFYEREGFRPFYLTMVKDLRG